MLWAGYGAVLKELSDGTRTSLLHFQHLFHVHTEDSRSCGLYGVMTRLYRAFSIHH